MNKYINYLAIFIMVFIVQFFVSSKVLAQSAPITPAPGSPSIDQAVNLRNYGAVGNGITDDTNAFHTAIRAAVNSNRALYVPSGIYNVRTLSDFFTRGVMFGDGIGHSILQQPVNDPTIVWGAFRSNTTYRDIEFRALAANGQYHRLAPAPNASNIFFDRVKISGFRDGYGLYLGHNCSNIQITNSHIEAWFWGITIVDCRNVVVANSYLTTTGLRAAVEVEPNPGGGADNIQFWNNIIDGNGTAAFAINLYDGEATNILGRVIFNGNTIRNSPNGIQSYFTQQLSVVNNSFDSTIQNMMTVPVKHYTDIVWQNNTWAGNPSVVNWSQSPVNPEFYPNLNGWDVDFVSGYITMEHRNISGGNYLWLKGENGAGGIKQTVRVTPRTVLTAKARYQLVSFDRIYPNLRVTFKDISGRTLSSPASPTRLSAPNGTPGLGSFHTATWAGSVPANAYTAEIRVLIENMSNTGVLVDSVYITGGGQGSILSSIPNPVPSPTPTPPPTTPTPPPPPPQQPVLSDAEFYLHTYTPVADGGYATLTWNVAPRFRVIGFNPNIGQFGNSGGAIISIQQTTTFTLTITDGTYNYSKSVTVRMP